jgi:hypothetical protein
VKDQKDTRVYSSFLNLGVSIPTLKINKNMHRKNIDVLKAT